MCMCFDVARQEGSRRSESGSRAPLSGMGSSKRGEGAGVARMLA